MGGAELRTPAFVVDEGLLKRNLELLADAVSYTHLTLPTKRIV